mmetsp:Transcript_15139/g.31401  ORF Transcript_15139/g.31401 Transcript_15139/m.31401 type:complete len:274 (-) Transcript_15139:24-845(-)
MWSYKVLILKEESPTLIMSLIKALVFFTARRFTKVFPFDLSVTLSAINLRLIDRSRRTCVGCIFLSFSRDKTSPTFDEGLDPMTKVSLTPASISYDSPMCGPSTHTIEIPLRLRGPETGTCDFSFCWVFLSGVLSSGAFPDRVVRWRRKAGSRLLRVLARGLESCFGSSFSSTVYSQSISWCASTYTVSSTLSLSSFAGCSSMLSVSMALLLRVLRRATLGGDAKSLFELFVLPRVRFVDVVVVVDDTRRPEEAAVGFFLGTIKLERISDSVS